jgi:hypothetical protein
MPALLQTGASVGEFGWDRQTLLLLGGLAFVLALWLLYRILKSRPQAREEQAVGAVSAAETTLLTKVPPPPLPKIEKILSRLEEDYPEFCRIVQDVLKYTPMPTLLAQTELRRGFAHLETVMQKADRVPTKGTLGIQTESKPLSAEARREAKATMLTVIRLLQDVQGIREKSGSLIDEQLDLFLERI